VKGGERVEINTKNDCKTRQNRGELKKKHKKGIKLHQHDEIRIHVNTIVEVKKKIPF
jgi:hypothetical protein